MPAYSPRVTTGRATDASGKDRLSRTRVAPAPVGRAWPIAWTASGTNSGSTVAPEIGTPNTK
jgi:hypothetical protein